MEQNKRMVTVTVTENGKETLHFTDNNVFIVSNEKGVLTASGTKSELLEFATLIQACFFNVIMPRLIIDTKPGVTEEMIFNDIVEAAKYATKDDFEEVVQ